MLKLARGSSEQYPPRHRQVAIKPRVPQAAAVWLHVDTQPCLVLGQLTDRLQLQAWAANVPIATLLAYLHSKITRHVRIWDKLVLDLSRPKEVCALGEQKGHPLVEQTDPVGYSTKLCSDLTARHPRGAVCV